MTPKKIILGAVNWYFVLVPASKKISKAGKEDITLLHVFDKEGFVDALIPAIDEKVSRVGKKVGTAFIKERLSPEEMSMGILDLCFKKLREDLPKDQLFEGEAAKPSLGETQVSVSASYKRINFKN